MENKVILKNEKSGKKMTVKVGPNGMLALLPIGVLGVVWQAVYLGRIGGAIGGLFFALIGAGLFTGLGLESSVKRKIKKLRKNGWILESAEGDKAQKLVNDMDSSGGK